MATNKTIDIYKNELEVTISVMLEEVCGVALHNPGQKFAVLKCMGHYIHVEFVQLKVECSSIQSEFKVCCTIEFISLQ